RTRAAEPDVQPAATVESLDDALRAKDEGGAGRLAAGLVSSGRTQEALGVLALQATLPRDDPHGPIYAAALLRMMDVIPPDAHAMAVSHLARFLARQPAWEAEAAPLTLDEADATPPLEIAHALTAGAVRGLRVSTPGLLAAL